MKFRAVITDLDGTLLNAAHSVSEFTKETLKLLQRKSIPVIFATGRPYPDVLHTIDSCGLDGGYIITSNGARVHDPQRHIIISRDLDPAVVSELVQVKIDNDINDEKHEKPKLSISTNLYRLDEWVTNLGVEKMLKAYAGSGFRYKEVDLETYPHNGVHEVFYVGEPHNLSRVEEVLQSRFADKVEFSFSLSYILDAVPLGVHKGKSMAEVADIIGVDLKDIIAFGDGMNDLKMLQAAGKGCIMSNANPKLKEALPDLEIIGCNEDDAVAKKLREVFDL